MTTVALRRYFLMTCAAFALNTGSAVAETAPGRVGVATAVNTTAESLPPRGTIRPLVVGLDIEQGERIDTDSSGRAQLLFLDGSTITIGNRASVVVDDFVFDADSRRGHLALSMARGLMRFIGGYLSKDGSVVVRTPTALLGIRGAIVMIEVAPDTGSTTATLLFGDSLTVTGRLGAVEVIRRVGHSITVGVDGLPSQPRRITPEQLKPLDQAAPNNIGGSPGLPLAPSPPRQAELDMAVSANARPAIALPNAATLGVGAEVPADIKNQVKPAAAMIGPALPGSVAVPAFSPQASSLVLPGPPAPDLNALRMSRQDLQPSHLPDRPAAGSGGFPKLPIGHLPPSGP
ncbi:MAG TPA: hypothetical protein HPQ04_00640 [Rhodospirillaceae bacterium]|nr:hypothetical protein [Rhodospirillaceae bacterium]